MAIALVMDFRARDLDALKLYDEANKAMHTETEPSEGLIFHWAAKTADGLRVVDVWQSREHFDRFLRAKLGPTSQALGIPQPEIEQFEIHKFIEGKAARS